MLKPYLYGIYEDEERPIMRAKWYVVGEDINDVIIKVR